MFFYKFFQILFYLPFRLLYPTKVYGRKNLVKGGAVLIANHQSYVDSPLLGFLISKPQHFLTKKEVYEKGFTKFVLKIAKAIPINREKPELSSIKKCLQVLKEDKYLTIFPQGTRKENGKMENLKGGVLMFSAKTDKPIIPMFIEKKPKMFRLNKLHIGAPIYPQQFSDLTAAEKEEKLEQEVLKFYKSFEK
ncbi:MAG: lysophospholipid acyltransferase family protein [Christensenellales bacterium]|jgi:1-acyl-sn-glycerol-3-phosphate acyltransferase